MTDDFYREYEAGVREYRLAFSRSCGYVGVVLVLLGVMLDYALYPGMLWTFLVARVAVAGMILLIVLAMYTPWGKRQAQWLTFLWLFLPQIMIAWMISVTEGADSLYYFGLSLAIFASGTLPFSFWQNIVFGALSCLLYVVACWVHSPDQLTLQSPFLVNCIFFIFSVTIGVVCIFFNERARFTLFRLKAEVAEKNLQLEATNKDLGNIKGQLLQQEKMAAIGTLSAGLLHEVNNPVNFCLMALEVAQTNPDIQDNAEVNECLVDVRQGMERIRHIVSDLKTFAYRKADATMPHTSFFLSMLCKRRFGFADLKREKSISLGIYQPIHWSKAMSLTSSGC
jgi:two-component system sensor histidine kinase PhcS